MEWYGNVSGGGSGCSTYDYGCTANCRSFEVCGQDNAVCSKNSGCVIDLF